jgi:hypothetical protein
MKAARCALLVCSRGTAAALIAAALVLGAGACGGAPLPTPTVTSTAPPTTTATASSTPTPSSTPSPSSTPPGITYRLTEGSTILSSPAPAGLNLVTLEEPLSGTFTAVPQLHGGPFCLNTLLCLSVTTFQFQSAHFAVTAFPSEFPGSSGQITQTTFYPDVVFIDLTSSINDQPIILNGSGPFDPNSRFPPTFGGVEICGAPPGVGGSCAGVRAGSDVGYDVILFATPDD